MSNIRKLLVAATGFILLVLSTVLAAGPELIPIAWLPYVQVIIALLAGKGVYDVRNVPKLYPTDHANTL